MVALRRRFIVVVAALTVVFGVGQPAEALTYDYDMGGSESTLTMESRSASVDSRAAQLTVGGLHHVTPPEVRLRPSVDSSAPQSALDDVLPKPGVSNAKLQNVVDDLYKGTTNPNRVGTGTTADAVRNEVATGLPTGGRFHAQKAEQYSSALRSILKQDLSASDRLVAQSLLDDLQRSLQGLP